MVEAAEGSGGLSEAFYHRLAEALENDEAPIVTRRVLPAHIPGGQNVCAISCPRCELEASMDWRFTGKNGHHSFCSKGCGPIEECHICTSVEGPASSPR